MNSDSDLAMMTRLHELSTRLMQRTELEALLEGVLDSIVALQNADFGVIQVYVPETQSLKRVAHRGLVEKIPECFLSAQTETAPCRRALAAKTRVIIEDAASDANDGPHRKVMLAAGFRAVQATPLYKCSGEPLCVIATHFRSAHRPSPRELQLTDVYAQLAAQMIERKQAEDALRESEERLRLAQEIARVGTYERNFATGVSRWSPEAGRLYGLAPGSMPKTLEAFLDLVHPEDRPHVEGLLKQSFESGDANGEWRVAWPDGTVRWICGRWRVFKDAGGKPTRLLGIDFDITERKQAEEALERSEQRFRAVYERSPVGICVVDDTNGRFLQVNRKFCEITGRAGEDLLGSDFYGITHPDDVAESKQKWDGRDTSPEGEPIRFRKRYVRPDGSVRWVDMISARLSAVGENPGLRMAIVHDITEQKQAEDALRTSEERFRLALNAAPVKVYTQDRNLRYTWVHGAIDNWPIPDLLDRTDQEIFAPDDAAHITQLKRRVLESGQPERSEFSFTRDGRTYYCDISVEPLRGPSDQIVGVRSACFDFTRLREMTEELKLAKERLTEEKLYLEQTIDTELGFKEIVGKSAVLKAAMEQAGRVAVSDATVLLLGETGTGKELIARAIHRLSQRAGNSFIKMNCAAIPTGLLESELFGHEKGAFTGAVSRKIGRLELADGGTLFLDEIGEIPLALQPKLLRVLQDREFERLGGTQTMKVDFRLIAATNRDLEADVRENKFRSDLYYRLHVFPVRVPPLRERREDIWLLVEHFVQKFARRMNKSITSIPKKTMDAMLHWQWPGNVRELENFVERAVILTQGSVLSAPLGEFSGAAEAPDDTLKATERALILRALRESRWKIGGPGGAAVRLGLKRTTLQSKLKQMGIERGEA